MVMMENMLGQKIGEEGESEEPKSESLVEIEKYKNAAEKMGQGVKFISAKEVKNKDGTAGVEVVYSFEDIRQLNLSLRPENPVGDQMAGMMDAESEEDETPITFDFKKGSTPKLIVNIPKEKESGQAEEKQEGGEAREEMDLAGLDMMKQFFQGFRIRLMINFLEGKITKTNATFVKPINGRETVTLFNIDFGKIMSDEKYMKEFKDLDKIKDMNIALERMKNIPGLKIETSERVEISFK
jgi:hypothetical protein